MNHGVQGFIHDLTELGLDPTVEAELVIYRIEPVDGAHASTTVETGVSANELSPWPQAPPHWIHLPASISFPGNEQSGFNEAQLAEAQPRHHRMG